MPGIEEKRVRMAEYYVGMAPEIIATVGLGSCVGISIYDPRKKIGGLIHIMLPENKKGLRKAKYADTGIPLLLNKMKKAGAKFRNLEAKIAGGAHMFNLDSENSSIRIGRRNVESVKAILHKEGIDIIGEDTGANYGRTMKLFTEDGRVMISSYKKDTIYL